MDNTATVIGYVIIWAVGGALFLAANFACYYFPTKLMIAKAGLPAMAMRYYLQGFAGMVLAGFMLALGADIAMREVPRFF